MTMQQASYCTAPAVRSLNIPTARADSHAIG
jgi:hypothetical protein